MINELSHERRGRDLPGRPRIRTCLPGGNQADLFPGETQIRHPGPRRIPPPNGQGRILPWRLGIPKENIFILNSGDVLELSEEDLPKCGQGAPGAILVDGLGVGDVGNIVLRDRQNLAQDGIIIVVLTLEKRSSRPCGAGHCVQRLCVCERVGRPDGRGQNCGGGRH